MDTLKRFWSKVTKTDGCWTWKAGHLVKGYGSFYLRGRHMLAHRVIFEILNGPIPEGMLVLHRCDNPPCVRPDHLFLGNHADNMIDAIQKGRKQMPDSRGTGNGRAKLTNNDVLRMRTLRASGRTFQSIASEYGMAYTATRAAITGENWRHLPLAK